MRKLTITALALTLLAALAPIGQTADRPVLSIVHVDVTDLDKGTVGYLMTHFDETHNHGTDYIELLMWPGDLAELDSMGIDYDVEIEDLVAHDRALAENAPQGIQVLPGPDRDDYRVLADYYAEMEEIAKKNPDIVNHFKMPRASLEGRDIFGLEIAANVKKDDGRPVFYMDAVHHAREWPAAEFTMMYAHYLTEKFGKDAKITKLLKTTRVILVPVVNVDGFTYSRSSPTAVNRTADEAAEVPLGLAGLESYWRKNRRSLTGVTAPAAQVNPDAYGVDPNRNYAYLWGDQQGGSSNDLHDQTYRGEAPFSEPEPSNVRDVMMSNSVTGVITNHTVQASVLRAGGGNAPDDDDLERIGGKMAKILKFRNSPTVGYPTTGTTDDWSYAAFGAYGFTIEHGGAGFHCAYADCVGTPADRTMKAFDVMLGIANDPKYHSVLTGKVAGGNAKLTLSKTFKTPLSPGNPLGEEFVTEKLKISIPTAKNGSFEWHVGPSDRPYEKKSESYTLTITAGGKTKTLNVHVERGQKVNLGTIKL